MIGLPYGGKTMTICKAVFIWYLNVTDGRMVTALVFEGSGKNSPFPTIKPTKCTRVCANLHFAKLSVRPASRITVRNFLKCNRWDWKSLDIVQASSIYASEVSRIGYRIVCISLTKVLGAFRSPNGILRHYQTPWWVTNADFQRSSGLIKTCQKADFASQIEIQLALDTLWTQSVKIFIGIGSGTVKLLRYRKSQHKRTDFFGLTTLTTPLVIGMSDGSINTKRRISSICFSISTFSTSGTLYALVCLGTKSGVVLIAC